MASLFQLAVRDWLGIDAMLGRLDAILEVVTEMGADQAALDAALASFASDLDTALASIQAKLDQLPVPLDLSSEVGTIQSAQARLDQFVSGLTPAATAVAEVATPPEASGVTTGVFDNTGTSTGTSGTPTETLAEPTGDGTGTSGDGSGTAETA